MENYKGGDDDSDDDSDAGKKKKGKKKKKKDPNEPKRNMSSFMFFSIEMRPQWKKDNPEAKLGELVSLRTETFGFIANHVFAGSSTWCSFFNVTQPALLLTQGKLIGEKFKALTPEEKAKYEKKAADDKERYKKEMAAYKAKQKGGGDAGGDESDGIQDMGSDSDDSD